MKNLTREIMLERIETKLTENGLQKKFDFTELLESDLLFLFIEFAEELIQHSKSTRGFLDSSDEWIAAYNEGRQDVVSELRAKLEALGGKQE